MSTDNAVAAPEKASRWEDFIDIIFSPAEVYERRAEEGWLKPFLIVSAVAVALYYLLLPVTGVVWEVAMQQNAPPEATAEQMQQTAQLMRWVGGIMVPFGYLFMIAVAALSLKLVSALIEPGATWRQSFLIPTLAMFITVPQSIISAIPVFIKTQSGERPGVEDMSFGALRFAGPDVDPVLRALLGRLDIFAIWMAILIGIGLVHVVRMPRGKAFITAAIVWALIALPGLASAALFSR